MILEENVFSEIIRALGAVPGPEGELRRRRVPRYVAEREILITPFGVANPASRQVMLADVSLRGVCIVDRVMIAGGGQFTALLPVARGGTLSVLCTSRQCRLGTEGGFRIGAEFTSETELGTRFVSGVSGVMAAPTATALRAAEAQSAAPQPAMLQVPATGKKAEAAVRGFSGGCFQIHTSLALLAGEKIVLVLRFRKRIQAWRCTVLQTGAAEPGMYTIIARNDGPAESTRPQGGILDWLKKNLRG